MENGAGAVSASRRILVNAPGGLAIATGSLPSATLRTAYSRTLAVEGGLAPYSWSITAGALPEGLAFDATTGTVSGTPTYATAADASVTVAVTDAAGQKAERQVRLFVGLRDEWEVVSPMSTPRAGHLAAVLADGRVLVAGGISGRGSLTSAEIFDPGTGRWSPTGSMSHTHTDGQGLLLHDGRVLVAEDSGIWSYSEAFSPGSGTWQDTVGGLGGGILPLRRSTMTLLGDGTVLLTGGWGPGGSGGDYAWNESKFFDPRANLWSNGPPMSVARAEHTATLLADGRVLVAGGLQHDGGLFVDNPKPWATTELYDPTSRSWSPGAELEQGRLGHAAALTGAEVVMAGGAVDRDGNPASRTEASTPPGPWASSDPPATNRMGNFLVTLHDGRVLWVAGKSTSDTNSTPTTSTMVFDPRSRSWTPAASLHQPHEAPNGPARSDYLDGASVTVLPDGRVMVAGGTDGSDPIPDVEIYG